MVASIIIMVIRRLEEEGIFPRSSTKSRVLPSWTNNELHFAETDGVIPLCDPTDSERANDEG